MKNRGYMAIRRKDGTWSIKRLGMSKTTVVYKTQIEAWKEARRLALGAGSEACLIGRDGKICARNTYVDNSFPLKNKNNE